MMTSMAGSETTVLDRQLALFKWQQQHEISASYFSNQLISSYLEDHRSDNQHGNEIGTSQTNVWPDLAIGTYPLVRDRGVSSESCPSPVKRKSVDAGGIKVGVGPKEENIKAVKRAKKDVVVEAETEIQQTSNEDSEGRTGSGASQKTLKEKSKAAAPERTDYIHVRARRGQATDSHSLAERVRREKISERMKYLQDLVPGCNKITGKAGMLDEIINYVQSLQKQVEFLSMKLAAAHPRIDFSMDQLFCKEINQAVSANIPRVGMSSEVVDQSYLQFNSMGDAVASCGFDTTMHQSGLPLRRNPTIMSVSDAAVDSSLNVHGSSLAWENDIQNLYNLEFHQGRGLSLPFQFLQGMMMSNAAKMEL